MISNYCNTNMRQDFFFLVSEEGKGNGDPADGGHHRMDVTGHGLWTDAMIKSAWRRCVVIMHGNKPGNQIYIQNRNIALNDLHAEAYEVLGITSTGTKQKRDDVALTRRWMCEQYLDVRTFGAVMTTGKNCGQVQGPLQITFARSVEPIDPMRIVLTRAAVTKAEDLERKETDMGEKSFNPFGLYLAYGFFTPHFAKGTGFSSDDFALFWQVLQDCWQFTRSAGRGVLELRYLGIYSHENPFGNEKSYRLFNRLIVEKQKDILVARRFEDYNIKVNLDDLPQGITYSSLVN